MIVAPLPDDELRRLAALRGHELLDSKPEPLFDALTSLASNVFDVPIAVVSLVDDNRQWFKSQCGLEGVASTSRDVSFCAHAILESGVFEVPDAALDPRFFDNPLVTGFPAIRYYAGAPLVDYAGNALGTLCLIDHRPRSLTPAQKSQLQTLARAVSDAILLRVRTSEVRGCRHFGKHDRRAAISPLRKRRATLKALARSITLIDALSARPS